MQKQWLLRLSASLLALAVLSMSTVSCKKKPETESSSVNSSSIAETSTEITSSEEITSPEGAGSTSVAINSDGTLNIDDNKYEIASNAISAPPGTDKIEISEKDRISILALKDPVIKEIPMNLKGKTITVNAFTEYSDQYNDWFAGMQSYYAAQLKSIEKDYNCTIKWVKVREDNYAETILTAISAGIQPANIFSGWMPDLINAGVFRDLRTVKNVDLAGNDWGAGYILNSTFNNKIYGVNAGPMGGQGIWFNKTLAKKYNLPDFYELVLTRQWTFDKFVNICQEIYNKSNHQIYGCGLYFKSDLQDFVLANGTAPIVLKKGKAVFNGTDSKVLNALSLVNKEGVFNPNQDYSGYSGRRDLIDGKVLFNVDHLSAQAMLTNAMTDDYGLLPFPMGPDTNEYVHMIKQAGAGVYSLYVDDPDIETSAAIMVAMANRIRMTNKQNDEYQRGILRDEESLQMYHYINGDQLKVVRLSNVPSYVTAINQIISGQQTPAQAMQAIINPATEEIEEMYNKGGGKAPQYSE